MGDVVVLIALAKMDEFVGGSTGVGQKIGTALVAQL
jgi:hypothetical protein